MASKQTLWQGGPGQIVNFNHFALSALGCAVAMYLMPLTWALGASVVIASIAGWDWLVINRTHYEIDGDQLSVRRGVFNIQWEKVELYRIEDSSIHAPFLYRMVGQGSILLETSDRTAPRITLVAVPDYERLREKIRDWVEEARRRKGVRLIE